jgi:hypothetical protein
MNTSGLRRDGMVAPMVLGGPDQRRLVQSLWPASGPAAQAVAASRCDNAPSRSLKIPQVADPAGRRSRRSPIPQLELPELEIAGRDAKTAGERG